MSGLFITLITLGALEHIQCLNSNLIILDNPVSEIPVKFLTQLNTSYLIIHFENATAGELFKVFGARLASLGTYLFNYDLGMSHIRVPAHSYINIVYLRNTFDFEFFSFEKYNIRSEDVVFIINKWRNMPKNISWLTFGSERSAGLFFFNLFSNELYIQCHCYNDDSELRMISKSGKIEDIRQYLNNYKNLRGHTFQIAHPDYPPFFYCRYVRTFSRTNL